MLVHVGVCGSILNIQLVPLRPQVRHLQSQLDAVRAAEGGDKVTFEGGAVCIVVYKHGAGLCVGHASDSIGASSLCRDCMIIFRP